ncbi:bacitracin resistance protein [uncultured Microbacterium sp.]|uniref:bacitracin resistance protein n=1 Tax=uncultured Microbacterium sp. TaxID=191216 RepID=UPI0035CA18B9
MGTPAPSSTRRAPILPVWIVATISGIFGLLYAYVVWNAATLLAYQASGVLGINGLGWLVLLLAVLFPIIVFAIAFAVGYRRRALPFAAILLTGLALVAVFWMSILAYAYAYGGSLLG